jgi:hypothetical protein
MRHKFALCLLALGALLEKVPHLSLTAFALAADGDAKKLSLGEQLSAWLREKESMAAELKQARDALTAEQAAHAQTRKDLELKAAGAQAMETSWGDKARDAEAARAAAESKLAGVEADLAVVNGHLASVAAAIGFDFKAERKDKDGKVLAPGSAEYTAAVQAAWQAHVANGVTQKLAELGIKEEKLPAAAHTAAETEEDLVEQLTAARTPAEKGAIAAKLNRLRDARWAASGSN